MRFRFNSEINVKYEIDEQTGEYHTLKLILQPIVENCFTHGFGNFERSGNIVIRAYIREQYLCFEVEDDGAGIVQSDAECIEASIDGSAKLHNGIGLHNVNKRTLTWFGEDYGLRFHSSPNKGIIVTVLQPCVEKPWESSQQYLQP